MRVRPNVYRCGADYRHRPHSWVDFDDGERVWRACDGMSDEEEELDQQAEQDLLYERGWYAGEGD